LFSILFLIYGIMVHNYVLSFIGVFIFYSAFNEFRFIQIEEILNRHTLQNIIRTKYTSFRASDNMELAASELNKGFESNFLVLDDYGKLAGILYEEDILEAMRNRAFDTHIQNYLHPDYISTNVVKSVKDVYNDMLNINQEIIPIYDDENLLGVTDLNSINNYIRIQRKY
jgi:predicted transcriptional regulator